METTHDLRQPALALRVGDAERQACTVALIEHHLQGRLSAEELERRQDLAATSVTRDDLRVLLADLPTSAQPTGRGRLAAPAGNGSRAAWALPPVVAVGVAGWFGQATFVHSAEGHYYTAAVAGALGYATHAATALLRRR